MIILVFYLKQLSNNVRINEADGNNIISFNKDMRKQLTFYHNLKEIIRIRVQSFKRRPGERNKYWKINMKDPEQYWSRISLGNGKNESMKSKGSIEKYQNAFNSKMQQSQIGGL